MAQNQHPPMTPDESRAQIVSILASCKGKLQQSSKPAENSSRSHASQLTPSFTMAEALKYMGHFTPMWVSNTNDSTTDATLTFMRLEKSSTDGRLWIWTNEPWIALDEMKAPRHVVRATNSAKSKEGMVPGFAIPRTTNPAKSEEGMVPGYVKAPMAKHSVVIRRRAGGKEGEDQGKDWVRWYLTPLDEDAIGETGGGWLCKVMKYAWEKANAGKPQ